MGTDGVCHYPLGSDDQTHPWFYGLHAYFKSDIPTAEERHEITAKMKEVADVLQSTGWMCPCDGAFKGRFRGSSQGSLAKLVTMETEESLWAQYLAGLAVNAKNALAAIAMHTTFDNNDTKVFGNADWRAVYATWYHQATQADAARLSEICDKAIR